MRLAMYLSVLIGGYLLGAASCSENWWVFLAVLLLSAANFTALAYLDWRDGV